MKTTKAATPMIATTLEARATPQMKHLLLSGGGRVSNLSFTNNNNNTVKQVSSLADSMMSPKIGNNVA